MQPRYDHEAFLRAEANLFGVLEHERRERERRKTWPRWVRTLGSAIVVAAMLSGLVISIFALEWLRAYW